MKFEVDSYLTSKLYNMHGLFYNIFGKNLTTMKFRRDLKCIN